MDPIHAKFYQANFEIESGAELLSLKGLVSEQGITKIFLSELPSFWAGLIGHMLTVRLDRMLIRAVFLQQFVEHGTFFELRFRDLEEPHRQYIRQRILAEGISPGWQRQFPRIPVSSSLDPTLPVPSLCMVHFLGQETFVNVTNFTLGGIRIQTLGDELKELRVGAVIQFDLGTSTGMVLPGLSGEVRNMNEEEKRLEGEPRVTRSFGLRLVNWDPANERKYKNLIKDYCLALQKQFSG